MTHRGPVEPPLTGYTRTDRPAPWWRRVSRKIHWPSVISAVCVLLIAVIVVYVVLQDSPARSAADRAAVVAKPTATPGTAVPSRNGPEYSPPIGDTIDGDGEWLVGKQIMPGVYRSDAGAKCYWERLSGLSGSYVDLLANGGYRRGPQLVEVKLTDFVFTSQGCKQWVKVMDR